MMMMISSDLIRLILSQSVLFLLLLLRAEYSAVDSFPSIQTTKQPKKFLRVYARANFQPNPAPPAAAPLCLRASLESTYSTVTQAQLHMCKEWRWWR